MTTANLWVLATGLVLIQPEPFLGIRKGFEDHSIIYYLHYFRSTAKHILPFVLETIFLYRNDKIVTMSRSSAFLQLKKGEFVAMCQRRADLATTAQTPVVESHSTQPLDRNRRTVALWESL